MDMSLTDNDKRNYITSAIFSALVIWIVNWAWPGTIPIPTFSLWSNKGGVVDWLALGLPLFVWGFVIQTILEFVQTANRNPLGRLLRGRLFVTDNVTKGSVVRTDGWHYDELKAAGYRHIGIPLHGDPEATDAHLPLIHLIFSNLKTWILGTHHGTSQQHLQAYLNEYTFRFNRRFYPMTAFNSVLGIAARTVPPTYESLYSGEWEHPGSEPKSPQIELPFPETT